MLPKAHRLTEKYNFNRVKRFGRTYRGAFFHLAVARSLKPAAPTRFGFVVSKRLDKRAAVRNRLKRLLREAVRKRLPVIAAGFEAVFYIRPSLKGKSYEDVCVEVDKILPKTPLVERPVGQAAFSHR